MEAGGAAAPGQRGREQDCRHHPGWGGEVGGPVTQGLRGWHPAPSLFAGGLVPWSATPGSAFQEEGDGEDEREGRGQQVREAAGMAAAWVWGWRRGQASRQGRESGPAGQVRRERERQDGLHLERTSVGQQESVPMEIILYNRFFLGNS